MFDSYACHCQFCFPVQIYTAELDYNCWQGDCLLGGPGRGTWDVRDVRDVKDVRDVRDVWDVKDVEDVKDVKDVRSPRPQLEDHSFFMI